MRAPDASEEGIRGTMNQIAKSFGRFIPGRSGQHIERVTPKFIENAPVNSPSRIVGLGQIAFHIDGAHHLNPPKFLMLACVQSCDETPTLLIDTQKWAFTASEIGILRSAVFFIRNGRKSFYSSILGSDTTLLRFDPYCMLPQNSVADKALNIIREKIKSSNEVNIYWEAGEIIMIDNRRILHARSDVFEHSERLLLRGAIE